MIITKNKLLSWLQWISTVFMLSSFLLFDAYSWGKYAFFLCAVLIFFCSVSKNHGSVRIRIDGFVAVFFLFLCYTALSSLWAIHSTDSLTMARTLLRIFLCYLLIYWAYLRENDPNYLLSAIIIASYLVAFYSVTVYGFQRILNFSDDLRREESYANINSIALFLVFGFICEFYLLLYRGFHPRSLISLLSIIIVISTRSRKAVVFLILGVMALLLHRYAKSKHPAYSLLRAAAILIGGLLTVYMLAQLPALLSVRNRLLWMINTFLGSGKMDTSSIMRQNLIRLGLNCFSRKPLTGIGMACTYSYAAAHLYFNSYLHNNYVELLAGGGLPAFSLFYSFYAILLYRCFRIKKKAPQWYALCIVMILLLLITDYGRVSYYSKTVLFEIMSLFLILEYASRGKGEPQHDSKACEVSQKSGLSVFGKRQPGSLPKYAGRDLSQTRVSRSYGTGTEPGAAQNSE